MHIIGPMIFNEIDHLVHIQIPNKLIAALTPGNQFHAVWDKKNHITLIQKML